ncbi:MAG: D-alanyl-D-alanine carboxypeptidase family protein [Acidimicrobiales bacterium]
MDEAVARAQRRRPPTGSRAHRSRAETLRFWRRRLVLLAVVALIVVGVVAATSSSPSRVAASGRGSSTKVKVAVKTVVVPGAYPALKWPKVGQAAVAVRGVGIVGRSPRERPVPIASLTKMMTAYVILQDHPLAPGEAGPTITVTKGDVAIFDMEESEGYSTVKVVRGESLSEYELLEALLIPSGDNIAGMLATWDAGSIWRFVEKMNATAKSLGLSSTHYADASGVNPLSVSTAADQARLAADLMGNAVVRNIVRRSHVAFPVVKAIWNANPAVGVDGILGVQSGWTLRANGCLVTAAWRTVRLHGVLVIVATLGQPDGLWNAAHVDEALLDTATASLVAYRVADPGATVTTVTLPGGVRDAVLVAPTTSSFAVVWRGLKLSERVTVAAGLAPQALANTPTGSIVGELSVVAPWGTVAKFPLRLAITPTGPSGPTAGG